MSRVGFVLRLNRAANALLPEVESYWDFNVPTRRIVHVLPDYLEKTPRGGTDGLVSRKDSRPRKGVSQRLPRGARKRQSQARRGWDPDARRRAWLADETGTILRSAPTTIGLCYPNPYHTAMSSLGYQVIYRMMNQRSTIAAERIVLPDDVSEHQRRRQAPLSIESGRPLADFDLLAFSVAYDLDITGFFELLSLGGVPILRAERQPYHPPVILGGPLTASNALPFGPFIDLAVIGDGEIAVARLLDAIEEADSREDFLERADGVDGVWIPELHGDRVPAVQKVSVGVLPAVGQIVTRHTELSNMFLIESSRGCPRFCKFCLVRSRESPMREPELERVMAHIPEWAPRVGFVGAAVSEWSGIREALRRVIAMGKGVGVSSLRADRLDEEFVQLLAQGGYKTMTVASDAPSQRLRNTMAKGIKTRHLLNAARLGRAAGMKRLKLYVIIGIPGETQDDIDELIAFTKECAAIMPTALGVSPLVPKLHTPLGDAAFAGVAHIDRTLKKLRRALGGIAELRSTSAKWAWVEYRMSQGGQDAGPAALAAWRAGGGYRAWATAMQEVEERGALRAAERFELWPAAGMR